MSQPAANEPQIDPNLENFLEIVRLLEETDFDKLREYVIRQGTEIEDEEARRDMTDGLLPTVNKLAALKREIEREENERTS